MALAPVNAVPGIMLHYDREISSTNIYVHTLLIPLSARIHTQLPPNARATLASQARNRSAS